MSTEKKLPKYNLVDGFRLSYAFYPQAFRDIVKYVPQPDDVFLVTYPKCGTNWMHYIIFLIYNKGDPPKSGLHFFGTCPFPELMGIETIASMSRPGVIKTHLPFNLQPYSPEAKYIIVARNPKDCCVSFYHHTEDSAVYYDFQGGEFNDYFDLFVKGEVDYGDYFDHTLSWYEHRNDPNVLFLTYEEMKADISEVILKVSKFLDPQIGNLLESNEKFLQKIVENSHASKMKAATTEMLKGMTQKPDPSKMTPAMKHTLKIEQEQGTKPTPFRMVRKGIVGDWKNMMTDEQIQRIDKRTEEKLGGTELLQYWKDMGAV